MIETNATPGDVGVRVPPSTAVCPMHLFGADHEPNAIIGLGQTSQISTALRSEVIGSWRGMNSWPTKPV